MPPSPWRQRAWFLLAHFAVPIAISAGLNFLVAWLLYTRRPEDIVNVWFLPATLAGDVAVTIFVTIGLTYAIDSFAVHGDVRNGLLEARKIPSWLTGTLGRTILFFIHLPRPSTLSRPRFLLAVVLRGVLLGAVLFLPFWGPAIGVLYGLPRTGYFRDTNSPTFPSWPMPCIFKAVFGAVLGGLTTPFMAWMSLIRCHVWGKQATAEEQAGTESFAIDERGEDEADGKDRDKEAHRSSPSSPSLPQ